MAASPPPASGLVIGQKAHVQPVDDIVSQVIGSLTCNMTTVGTQSVVCSLTAHNCPAFHLVCSNNLTQNIQCTDTNFDARKVLQNEDLEGLAVAIKLSPTDDHKLDIDALWQKIDTNMTTVCNPSTFNDQSIAQSLICDSSSDVSVSELNQLDQTTACQLGNAIALARSAREYAAKQYNDAQKQRVQQWAMYGGIALAVVMVLIMLGVGFL